MNTSPELGAKSTAGADDNGLPLQSSPSDRGNMGAAVKTRHNMCYTRAGSRELCTWRHGEIPVADLGNGVVEIVGIHGLRKRRRWGNPRNISNPSQLKIEQDSLRARRHKEVGRSRECWISA